MRVVVDHVAGSRRGQRQELRSDKRVQFGRHPDCEVSFDAHKDIDASSRHAELRSGEAGWVLVDLGSSNGTYVDGRRVTEVPLAAGSAVEIGFGMGGPRIRLFIGDEAGIAALPPARLEARSRPWLVPALAVVAGVGIFFLVVARC